MSVNVAIDIAYNWAGSVVMFVQLCNIITMAFCK